jgi:hypothetical protein
MWWAGQLTCCMLALSSQQIELRSQLQQLTLPVVQVHAQL